MARGAVIYSRKARGISRRVVCDWQDAVTGRVLGESYGSHTHCCGCVDSNCAVGFDGPGRCGFFRNRYILVGTSGFEKCTVFIATVAFRDDVWNLVDSMWQWKEIALRIRRP